MTSNLLSAWSTIGSVLLAILILLAMITVHEFGHYLAGKIFKFEITEFSIGFGPALFKHRSKRSGELFAVRLIPLGGYCAFAGEDGLDEEEETTPSFEMNASRSALPEPFEETASPEEKTGEEAEEGGEGREEKIAEKAEEKPEEKAGEQPEDGARPLPSAGEKETEGTAKKDRSGYFTNRPCWQRIVVLVAGAFMNYLLALLLIVVGFTAYGQTMIAVYETEPATGEYVGYSFEDKDVFLQAEGKNLYLTSDIAKAVNGKKKGDLVSFRVSRIVGTDGEKNVREEMDVTVMLRADVEVKNSADFDGVWKALGVRYEAGTEETEGGYMLANSIYRFEFGEGLGRAIVYSFRIAGSIFQVLGELLTGRLGLSAFGGPVTTITMTSQIVSRGFRYFLEIAGYIGVNLAVFNLLPVPALDGSKVIFTAIEWVRGKPISRKIEAIIHAVGFLLLLGFAVLVDILQFV